MPYFPQVTSRRGAGGHISTRTLLIFQSGGPTAVLNASLAGAVSEALASGYGRVLGARRGVSGILDEAFIDLTDLSGERLKRLRDTPSAGLGTSRHRPSDDEIDQMLDICSRNGIEGIVAIGGNDTAETGLRLSQRVRESGRDAPRIIGVPKTIDNDLAVTDHSLGYGSAGRFIALATRDAIWDTLGTAALNPVKIVEVMGRNAGWLAAAGTLALDERVRQPLVCLPERPFSGPDQLVDEVARRLESDGYVALIAPETMRWADGGHVAGDEPEWVDQFGHPYFPSAGHALARLVTERLGVRSRYDKPGTISRMAMHAASQVDMQEAWESGVDAVRRLVAGETGMVVAIERLDGDPYSVRYGAAPFEYIANIEWRIPDAMIDESGHGLTAAFRDYALPLVGGPFEPYELLVESGVP